MRLGEYGKAEPLHLQARDIREKVLGKEHSSYAVSLNNLAVLYESMGDYTKAESLFLQARDIAKEVLGEEHPHYATCLNNLALLYGAMGDYAKAEPLLLQARDIRKEAQGEEHPDYAMCLNNLASLYGAMGDYAEAEPLLLQARDIWKKVQGKEHPHYVRGLDNLAHLYGVVGDYAKAEPLAQASLDIGTRFRKRVGNLLPEAGAMALAKPFAFTGPHTLLWVLRKLPGGHGPQAYKAVWNTRGLVSHSITQRHRFAADSPAARRIMVQLQTTAQQLAQLTLAVPAPDQRLSRHKRLSELNDQKERLERELAKLSVEFRRSQEVRAAEVADLTALLPDDTAVVELVAAYVWDEHEPGKNRTGQWHYEAFVLRSSDEKRAVDVAWVHLGEAGPIDEAIGRWRAALTSEGRRGLDPLPDLSPAADRAGSNPARSLRDAVWEKIEPHLTGCTRVVVIPDGYLSFVPWAALPGREPGTFLIEDYAIATASYGRQLYALLSETHSPASKILLAGDVAYDERPSAALPGGELLAARLRAPATKQPLVWKPLSGTAAEVAAIAGLHRVSTQLVPLEGPAASETALRHWMPQSRNIHLATHGFFADESSRSAAGHDMAGEQLFGGLKGIATSRRARVTGRNPLILSGVVLAGANLPPKTDDLGLPIGEDGILTAEEIVNLDLRGTELVVLSACDTGLGKVAGGEGVMGLQRAFHLAGTRAVIASLWKVDDDATKTLMVEFYKNLWNEKMGKLEALRRAQLTMIRNYDSKTKKLRAGGLATKVDPDKLKTAPNAEPRRNNPLPPFYWAAFQLSGDWR